LRLPPPPRLKLASGFIPAYLKNDRLEPQDYLQYEVHKESPPAVSRIEKPGTLTPVDRFTAHDAVPLSLTIPFNLFRIFILHQTGLVKRKRRMNVGR
jgi:hypothetical protein